jgi:hypothetical protein
MGTDAKLGAQPELETYERPTEPGQSRNSGGPVAVLLDRAAHVTVTVSSRAGCLLSGCRVPVTEDCKWDTHHSTAQHSTPQTFFFNYFFTFTFYRLGYFGKKLKKLREVKRFYPPLPFLSFPFPSLPLSPPPSVKYNLRLQASFQYNNYLTLFTSFQFFWITGLHNIPNSCN